MRVLFLGDIIGRAGITSVKLLLDNLQQEFSPDFTLAGGAFVTRGFGLGKGHSLYLRKLGIQILSGGDMILSKQDLVSELQTLPFVLRPANFPIKTTPGRGFAYYKNKSNSKQSLGVLCLQGQAGNHRAIPNNPFHYTIELIEKLKQNTPCVVVCFHAMTTAEKQSMGAYLAGKVGAVIGYGGRAMTSDAKIVQSTACLTDCGYVGARYSAAGLDSVREIERLISQRPLKSCEADIQFLSLDVALVELDEAGHATNIVTQRRFIENREP